MGKKTKLKKKKTVKISLKPKTQKKQSKGTSTKKITLKKKQKTSSSKPKTQKKQTITVSLKDKKDKQPMESPYIPMDLQEEESKTEKSPDFIIQKQSLQTKMASLPTETSESKDFDEEFIEEFHDEPIADDDEDHEDFKDQMGKEEYDNLFDNPEEEDNFEDEIDDEEY